jgi:hypothetical protein
MNRGVTWDQDRPVSGRRRTNEVRPSGVLWTAADYGSHRLHYLPVP